MSEKKLSVVSCQWTVGSSQWTVDSGQWAVDSTELVFANPPKADEAISSLSPSGSKSREAGRNLTVCPLLNLSGYAAFSGLKPDGNHRCAFFSLGRLAIFLLLIGLAATVQAESSFSALGYGLLRDDVNTRSAALGLASVAAPDTLSIDLRNPAAWMGSPMTRFGFSASMVTSTTKEGGKSDESCLAEFTGAGLVLPLGESRFLGFTISPVSRMKYLWNSEGPAAQDWTTVALTQEGEGGLSQGLVGFSTPVTESVRLGVAARGLFGKNESYWLLTFPEADAHSTSRTVSDNYTGVGLTLAGYWRLRDEWAAGLVVNSPVSLQVEQRVIFREGYEPLEDSKSILSTKYESPWDIIFGAARLLNRQLVSVEAAWHGWDAVEEPAAVASSFRDGLRLSGGWEWTPEFRPFDPWWKALTYRAGVCWQNSYVLSPNGHQASGLMLTGGLGIPYFENKSRFDLSFQYGWRGSEDKDGAAEKYFMLSVGVNHKELWFVDRKERR